MKRAGRRRLAIAAAVAAWLPAAALGAAAAADHFSKQDAAQFQQKVLAIHAHAGQKKAGGLRTTITEREVNAYLALDAADALPPGIVDARVSLLGPGRLAGRATVDLDTVRREQKGAASAMGPMAYLTGKLPVTVTGVLKTGDDQARFQLESAAVAGIPVPRLVIEQLLAYYAKTPGTPQGVSLDSSFPLPDRIRQIDVQRGQAVVIQ